MRWFWLRIVTLLLIGLLPACQGTDTGNPADNDAPTDRSGETPGELSAEDCADDEFVCPDNTTVFRNPDDNCNFFPCP